MEGFDDVTLSKKQRKNKKDSAALKFKNAVAKRKRDEEKKITDLANGVLTPEDVFTEEELGDYNKMIADSKDVTLSKKQREN